MVCGDADTGGGGGGGMQITLRADARREIQGKVAYLVLLNLYKMLKSSTSPAQGDLLRLKEIY